MASTSQSSYSSNPPVLLYKYKEIRFYCEECGPTKLYTRERNSSKSKDQPTLERHVLKEHPEMTLQDVSAKYGHRFHYTDKSIRDLSFEEQKRNPPRKLRERRVRSRPKCFPKAEKETNSNQEDESNKESRSHTTITPQSTSTPLSVPELPALSPDYDYDFRFDFNTEPSHVSSTFSPSSPSLYTGYYINTEFPEAYEHELYSTLGSFDNDHASGTTSAMEDAIPIDPQLLGNTNPAEAMEMAQNGSGHEHYW